jgi:hypothetical protein
MHSILSRERLCFRASSMGEWVLRLHLYHEIFGLGILLLQVIIPAFFLLSDVTFPGIHVLRHLLFGLYWCHDCRNISAERGTDWCRQCSLAGLEAAGIWSCERSGFLTCSSLFSFQVSLPPYANFGLEFYVKASSMALRCNPLPRACSLPLSTLGCFIPSIFLPRQIIAVVRIDPAPRCVVHDSTRPGSPLCGTCFGIIFTPRF